MVADTKAALHEALNFIEALVDTKRIVVAVVVAQFDMQRVAAAAEEAERRFHVQVQLPEALEPFNPVGVRGLPWDVRKAMGFLRLTRLN